MSKIVDEPSMSDLFRAMDAEEKVRKEGRLQRASDLAGWTKHTPYHWSRTVNGERLNWWPSTSKWSYGMKGDRPAMYYGNQDQLLGFIKNREPSIQPEPEWATERIEYD